MKKTISLAFILFSVVMSSFAATTRIYCKMAQSWWKADGAAVGIYYWGTGTAPTWPGVRMTAVSGETDIWYADVDLSQYANVIFTRVNASGTIADWGSKTKDLTFPTDGKDMFTITTSSAVWGDPGCDGSWSTYSAGGGGDDPDPEPTCEDGPYGLQINDTTIVNAPLFGETDGSGRTQYRACVTLAAGDVIKLINQSCGATWMVDLDPYGAYQSFTGGATAGSVTCNAAGDYTFYIKLLSGNDVLYIGAGNDCAGGGGGSEDDPDVPSDRPDYETSVPSQATDVILQAFYYDSYKVDSTSSNGTTVYGDTRWKTLLPQASEISAYFDIVWFPPSAMSEGGTGYHPRQYSNQASDWGSRSELETLIAAFHNGGTKVIADIVANHAGCKSSWCDYFLMDFGDYGKFQPDASWITNDDEVWSSGHSECVVGANAHADDGYGTEAKYAAARDWDHQQDSVRAMFRAYTRWLKNVMMYDGYRYDYCKGFNMSHVNEYNSAAKNYISILEFWSGNDDIISRIQDAGMNTMAFDFQTKYQAFNNGIASGNYSGCKSSGLLGMGYSKYAVTFVDNHDTFLRDDNEFCGKGNSMKYTDKVLQCNAFILAMPGIPCVLYPHWVTLKPQISKMIEARHLAGVHSESVVSNEVAEAGGYTCQIAGKNGYLVLQLGNKAGTTVAGATKYAYGNGYAIWVKTNSDVAPSVIVTPGSSSFRDSINGIDITMEAVGGSSTGTIYYTTDGTDPTTSSLYFSATGTINIKTTTTLKVMAVCGTAQSAIQTFTYKLKEPQVGGITVRFLKPDDWTKVYFFGWRTEAHGGQLLLSGWPGSEIAQGQDGWYSYTFPADVDTVNFIINQGKGGLQSADLQTDCDVCYSWSGSNEAEIDCDKPIEVEFSLGISPDSKVFKDSVNGLDVTLTTIGSETAIIYYTIDGTEPTAASASFVGQGTLNFKQTATLKAFAVNGTDTTEVYTRTYTYKEPQTGPITVRFQAPEWTTINLYAWSTEDASVQYMGEWPGTKMTQVDDEGWYYYTFPDSIREVNVIFNNGTNQTSDIYVDEDVCYYWDILTNVEVYSPTCTPQEVELTLSVTPDSKSFTDATNGLKVTMKTPGLPAARIYYTVDGSIPTTASDSLIGEGIVTIKETTNLNAFAVNGEDKTEVITRVYTLRDPLVVTVTPGTTSFTDSVAGLVVSMSCTGSPTAKIYYTLDGTTPNLASEYVVVEGQITIHKTTKFRAKAIEGDLESAVIRRTYTLVEATAVEEVTLDENAPMYNVLGQRVDKSYRGIILQAGSKYIR